MDKLNNVSVSWVLALLFFLCIGCQKGDHEKIYTDKLIKISAVNTELKRNYQSAISDREKSFLENQARSQILGVITEVLFPSWYGTKYDFYGTTAIPQQGKVACGYFVSTVLRDAGFNLNRETFAQQASAKIIRSLVQKKYVSDYLAGTSLEKFKHDVLKQGDGLYLIGLDTHIGFMSVEGSEVFIIHAGEAWFGGVRKEHIENATVVVNSQRRIIGKLTADDHLLRRWLMNERIKIVSA